MPPGLGLGRIDQLAPFQASTSVRVAAVSKEEPTEMHRAEVVHDTLRRSRVRAGGFGLDTTDHAVPRHVSINVCRNESPVQPTATQLVAVGHDTPFKSALGLGLGEGMTDHTVPSHLSTSVR
jgi:hypothetical protein